MNIQEESIKVDLLDELFEHYQAIKQNMYRKSITGRLSDKEEAFLEGLRESCGFIREHIYPNTIASGELH